MAVYTKVSETALGAFLADYDIGELRSCTGIAEGIENSNYLLETTRDRYILTLFEKRVNEADLPFFIGLKRHLAASGFSCPQPIEATDGECLRSLAERPAVIVSFLDGKAIMSPGADHCRQLGVAMARMHAGLDDFHMQRKNDLGPDSWRNLWHGRAGTANELRAGLESDIEADLASIDAADLNNLNLPLGTIHADLFPDNVFFDGGKLSGFIDFYFACTDALVYDIAICLNAWCFNERGIFEKDKGSALIEGYETVRQLEPAERDALPALARGAALRFFLTRLIDWTDTPEDALVKPKDPLEYARKLDWHRSFGMMASSYGA